MKRLLYLLGRIVVEELRRRVRLLTGPVYRRYIPSSRRITRWHYVRAEENLRPFTWSKGRASNWKAHAALISDMHERMDRPANDAERTYISYCLRYDTAL